MSFKSKALDMEQLQILARRESLKRQGDDFYCLWCGKRSNNPKFKNFHVVMGQCLHPCIIDLRKYREGFGHHNIVYPKEFEINNSPFPQFVEFECFRFKINKLSSFKTLRNHLFKKFRGVVGCMQLINYPRDFEVEVIRKENEKTTI